MFLTVFTIDINFVYKQNLIVKPPPPPSRMAEKIIDLKLIKCVQSMIYIMQHVGVNGKNIAKWV